MLSVSGAVVKVSSMPSRKSSPLGMVLGRWGGPAAADPESPACCMASAARLCHTVSGCGSGGCGRVLLGSCGCAALAGA